MQFQIEVTGQLSRLIHVSFSRQEIRAAHEAEQSQGNDGATEVGERVAGRLCGLAIDAVISRFGLRPVGKVAADCSAFAESEQPACTLGMEVLPEIPLPEKLEELVVQVEEPVVQPGEFREGLGRFLRSLGKLEPLSERRSPADFDVVSLDVSCACGARLLPGLCAKDFLLKLRPGQEDMEIAELARTLRPGEEAQGTLRCPPEYPDASLRGKDLELRVRLNSIYREALPRLDDALAASLGRNGLQDLYEHVHKALLKRKLDTSRKQAEQRLLSSLVDRLDFPVPQNLLAIHKKQCMLEAERCLALKGLTGPQLQREVEALAADCRKEAERLARLQTYLMVLGYREKIVVSERDVEQSLKELAAPSGQNPDKLRSDLENSGAMPELVDRLLAEKALDRLYAKAKKHILDFKGNQVAPPQVEHA